MNRIGRPSLRKRLETAGSGNQVIGYLTLGDPPDRFLEVASEVIEAGALALELGLPHPSPKEGSILLESHRRAIGAGVDRKRALELLEEVSRTHSEIPLVVVVQWSEVEQQERPKELLESLSQAGAAAVFPIGVPLGELSSLSEQAGSCGMETVISCYPDTPARIRRSVLKCCSGCVYVPRGRGLTGAEGCVEIEEFCSRLSSETELPIVVGFGVERPEDVAEICATKAVAAAVGSALVQRVAEGEAVGPYVSSLTA